MNQLTDIRERIIEAVYEYKPNLIHRAMVEFIDVYSQLINNGYKFNTDTINAAFEAYKNNDFLRLADIFEFDL
ncbi:MAG: hypothetical protein CVU84_08330 [Firmicutes bacterium HGW-Firmicutes-1]|jgi:hypothetical protein|nr:MAG: hypothetical protein CVU84_08330 [Firmicutes bacterium HGW-Firmicutes-1]